MDRQLALLSEVDGKPRRSFAGRWAAEFGTVTFRPDLDRPGELKIEIDLTYGTPPSFNICGWNGGGVRESALKSVATSAAEGWEGATGAEKTWKVAVERDGPILRLRDLSAAKKGAPDPMPYCSKANELDATFIAVADDTTADDAAAVSFPAPKGEPKAKIGDLLALLPASAFDDTTDGIGEDDLKTLIANGESEDWRLERLSDRKARFVAKHPSSEVTLRLKMLGERELLEVAVQNEKAFSIAWYARKGDGGPLEPFGLRQALRVLMLVSAPGEGWPEAAIPEALADYADNADACARYARDLDKPGKPAEEAREGMKTLGCAGLPTRAASLARIHGGKALWRDYLERAQRLAGH